MGVRNRCNKVIGVTLENVRTRKTLKIWTKERNVKTMNE